MNQIFQSTRSDEANGRLMDAVWDIINFVTTPTMINIDIHDLVTYLNYAGELFISKASSDTGENPAQIAAELLNNPIIGKSISGAKGVIICIKAGEDVELEPCKIITDTIVAAVSPDANIIFATGGADQETDEIVFGNSVQPEQSKDQNTRHLSVLVFAAGCD